jgi:protein ImuA
MRIEPARNIRRENALAAPHQTLMALLRRQIARMENTVIPLDRGHMKPAPWTVGVPPIDNHLPASGLARSGLHDITPTAYGDMPAAMGFALALALRRLADRNEHRPLLWCRLARDSNEYGRLYGHGLETLGLPRHRFITVTLKTMPDLLWTMEEALRSGALALVLSDADPRHADLAATRRLALAAGHGRSGGLLIFAKPNPSATASHTRWRTAAARSQPPPHDPSAPGLPSWHIELTRARGGRSGTWTVEWNHASHRFDLVSSLCGGEIHPQPDQIRPPLTPEGPALRAG